MQYQNSPRSASHRARQDREQYVRELDALVSKLIAEIADLVKEAFTTARAGKPNVSVAGVLDAVNELQFFAKQQRGRS
jgi:hypothetical protein